MSGDREARAVGAGDTVTVGEKKFRLRPVNVQSLCDLERDALKAFKREVLSTYRDNLDMLPEGAFQKKVEEVSRWDVNSLPQKTVYSCRHLPVTDELLKWAESRYEGLVEETKDDHEYRDRLVRILVTDGLDNHDINPESVRQLCGAYPRQGRVRWDQWWVTGCTAGKLSFIYQSIRHEHPEVKEDDVARWPLPKISEAANMVEYLTAASVGNISDSVP